MPEPRQDAGARVKFLEQKLREMEASPSPDFAIIAAMHAELDALRKRVSGASSPAAVVQKPEMDDFHSWAADSSKRYVDPSIYGEGPQFAKPCDAEAVAPCPPKEAPKPTGREWTEDLERLKKLLIADVIKKAYESATLGGKKRLGDLAKEMMATGKPNAFSKFQIAVRKGIETRVKSLDLGAEKWEEVIRHLVVDLSSDFYDVEHRDQGATRIVQSFVAREFLSPESYRELDKQGVFDR